jgi:hypothetical protein
MEYALLSPLLMFKASRQVWEFAPVEILALNAIKRRGEGGTQAFDLL